VSRFLRERNPHVRIVAIEPPIGHHIQGLKNMLEAIRPKVYDPSMIDDKVTVFDDEAFEAARQLALQEGLFVGMSSGAALAGALRVARQMRRGTVVALMTDRGDRYLSTELFRSAGMDPQAKVA
jgi:S-sulfo-L-cysteine synthase (O-acetyl-L-serine-dependent)